MTLAATAPARRPRQFTRLCSSLWTPRCWSGVAGMLGSRPVTVVRGLRDGGSPWLLEADGQQVVLRVVSLNWVESTATEVAAMQLAAEAGIPVPELLGHDDGTATGWTLVLMSRVAGSSFIPAEPASARLRMLGAAAAKISSVQLAPTAALPVRTQPTPLADFARMRREQDASELLREAEEAVARRPPTAARHGLVHGDLWHGNTLWDDGRLAGIVDWDCAGTGAAGVDLGSLRCDAALCYGPSAPDEVLRGWEEEAGRPAADVAYWDAVAALASPPDLGWFVAAVSSQGRPDLNRPLMLERREEFLRQALDRLPG